MGVNSNFQNTKKVTQNVNVISPFMSFTDHIAIFSISVASKYLPDLLNHQQLGR